MKRRTQQFIAAFAITGIVIAALCGFVVVDLSTERYMPKEHGPLFLLTRVDAEGIFFTAAGNNYQLDPLLIQDAQNTLWQYRGILPGSVTLTGALTAQGYIALREYLESLSPPAEPW